MIEVEEINTFYEVTARVTVRKITCPEGFNKLIPVDRLECTEAKTTVLPELVPNESVETFIPFINLTLEKITKHYGGKL